MNKRFLRKIGLISVVFIVCCLSFIMVSADLQTTVIESGSLSETVNWSFDSDGLLRIYGEGNMPDNSYAAAYPWYKYHNEIVKVIIEDGIKNIGERAFYQYTSLRSVSIGDGVTYIGNSAFYDCPSLSELKLSQNLKTIDMYAFSYCEGIKEIDFPGSIETVKRYAFMYCSFDVFNLNDIDAWCKIDFGESMPPVSEDTQVNYKNQPLTEIVVPDGITTIYSGRFRYFKSLKKVTLPSTLESIEDSAFEFCESLESIVIPDSVTSMGSYCFGSCSSIKSVELPSELISMDYCAFDNCTSLTSIVIPESLTYIPFCAFNECNSLESITLHDGIESIGWGAFSYTKIKEITLPENLKTIDDGAFGRCGQLKKVEFPSKELESFGNNMFVFCNSLEEVTFASEKLTSIGNSTFYYCENLKKVVLPSKLEAIPKETFYRCLMLEETDIPQTVTSIGKEAFYECNMLNKADLPKDLTEIGESAFYNCYSIKSITIPQGVTEIKNYTFQYCSGITNLKLSEGIISIGNSAFGNCSGVTELVLPSTLTELGDSALSGMSFEQITLPKGITSLPFRVFYYCNKLKNISIIGVTELEEYVFSYCESLESIVLDEKLTSIPSGTFEFCKSLKSITIPGTVASIGKEAFCGCYALESVVIPDSVNTIGEMAFYDCTSLKEIKIPNGITRIENSTFAFCESLVCFDIPKTVTYIGSFAFDGCKELKMFIMPDSVTEIGSNVFSYCENIEALVLSNNLEKVGGYIFYGCSNLKRVVIPPSIKEYSDSSFSTDYYSTQTIYINNSGIISSIDSRFACGEILKAFVAIPSDITELPEYFKEVYSYDQTVTYYGVEFDVYHSESLDPYGSYYGCSHVWNTIFIDEIYPKGSNDCVHILVCSERCKIAKEVSAKHHSFKDGDCAVCGAKMVGFVNYGAGKRYYYEDGSYAKGWQTIDGKTYRFDGQGLLFEGESLVYGSQTFWFDADHAVREGLVLDADGYRFYIGGVRQYAWQDTDGDGEKDSYFYVSSYLRCEVDRMLFDGVASRRFYVYDAETGFMEKAQGFYTNENGTQYFVNGIGKYGWITPEGEIINDRPGVEVSGAYYFAYGDGINYYRVEDASKTIGGVTRVFDENHLVVAYTGWTVNKITGNSNYYVNGALQQGWFETPDGWVYLSRSENLANNITYGDAITGWKKIGGKVYYFRSASSTPACIIISDPSRDLTYKGVRKTYYINQFSEYGGNLVGSDFYILNYPIDL